MRVGGSGSVGIPAAPCAQERAAERSTTEYPNIAPIRALLGVSGKMKETYLKVFLHCKTKCHRVDVSMRQPVIRYQ